ncbi:MAG: glycosyltransferase family 4 protein [Bacteroidaceae bacterium]|nr:glycosyltransferase family 4 protein [Bacteroidaceae bacterium]
MKKKLLIFHPTIAPYRIDFFNDLYRAFDTRVCLQYWNLRDQTFDYDKIYAQFAFKPHYLKEIVKLGQRSLWGGFWKHLDNFNPDIVLVSEFNMTALMVLAHRFLKRKKYKVISICDDSYNMVAENNDFSKLHRIARRLIAPLLDNLILVEPKVTQWYLEHYGKGICCPIIKSEEKALKEYERVLPMSQETVKKYGLESKKVFLFVGRLVALKNVETIISAFVRLNQKENAFVVVGDGPERKKLEKLAKSLDANILFTGRLEGESLNVWYNIADAIVLASYQEAFGAVTNEALLAGCYALVSNKAGSSCLIEEGVNGYTFSPMNVEELAEKMDKISTLLYTKENDGLKKNMMRVSYNDHINNLLLELNYNKS